MDNVRWSHKRLVRAVVRKMLNGANEDVEQEIYLRLWQKYPTYREQDKLGAWIRTVAENYCKDYLRSKSQKLLKASMDEEEGGLEYISTGENPEKEWLMKCRRKLILEAVDALPKEFRKAVVMVEFEGLSYDKASQKLGLNVGTLKSRLHRAKSLLAEKLAYLEL